MRTQTAIARVRGPRKANQAGEWLLVLLAAGFLGWIAWQLFQPPPPGTPAPHPGAGATNPPSPSVRTSAAPAKPVPVLPAPSPREPVIPAPVHTPAPALAVTSNIPPAPSIATRGTNVSVVAPAMERILAAQIALVNQGISPGSIDGRLGAQTRAALRAFQRLARLPAAGDLDPATEESLAPGAPLYTTYMVASEDLDRLLPVGKTWLGKSLQSRLDYETILKLVAEKSQTHPAFLRRLNPELDWSAIAAGTSIRVPNAAPPPPRAKAAFARISLMGRTLQAFDQHSSLIAHFPCSIAQRVDKRPIGELHVAVMAPRPNYTLDPAIFPESAEARQLGRKLVLPPGPNNPVGTVWIGLDRPGYGIHGTPRPEEVGRTESHGCFRLANWNAEFFLKIIWLGMPVFVEE